MHKLVGASLYTAAAIAIASTAVVLIGKAGAMDREELKNVPPQIRQWFESMKSPSGRLC